MLFQCIGVSISVLSCGGEYSVVVCSVICLESVMFKRRSTHAYICMHLLPSTQHLLLSGLAWSMVHFNKSVTAGSAAFVIQLAMGCVQSRSQMWLRGMSAGVQRPSGLYHCLPLV